jgi:hypothetical protein
MLFYFGKMDSENGSPDAVNRCGVSRTMSNGAVGAAVL